MRALPEGTRRPGDPPASRRARADRRDGRSGGAPRPAYLSARPDFTGAIIAGGSASRLAGRPKGLEIVGGARIIDRVAAVLRETCGQLILAPGSLDASGWLRDARIASDLLPARASITGLHAAIAGATDNVLVVAWDMPFVPSPLLRALQSRLVESTTAVIPLFEGRPEPLCAAYAPGAAAHIATLVSAGGLKVSDIVARLPGVAWLEENELRRIGDPATMFFNVNTPADLDRAQEIAVSVD